MLLPNHLTELARSADDEASCRLFLRDAVAALKEVRAVAADDPQPTNVERVACYHAQVAWRCVRMADISSEQTSLRFLAHADRCLQLAHDHYAQGSDSATLAALAEVLALRALSKLGQRAVQDAENDLVQVIRWMQAKAFVVNDCLNWYMTRAVSTCAASIMHGHYPELAIVLIQQYLEATK